MRRIFSLTLMFGLFGAVQLLQAQNYTLTVEEHAVDIIEGQTTYRIYVDMVNETDFLSSVFGGENNALSLTTTTGFYNSQFGGTTAGAINPAFFSFAPDLVADSWISIGLESQPTGDEIEVSTLESNAQPFVPCFAANNPLDGTDVLIDDETGGAWYVLNGSPNGLPDEDMRVIILQITTAGELCGTINVQIFENGEGITPVYPTFSFCGAGVYSPSTGGASGCTDATACNYDADAAEDDGSCVFADSGYDCSGNCLNDADADGICDEFEVAGCTDAFACNYDASATDENGSCDYLSCSGCTDETACNFDPDAVYNDGSCDYVSCAVNGCTNSNACNFNPEATNDDGTCEYASCVGCTDSLACNYDMAATQDNGSCEYPESGLDCSGNCLNDMDEDGICDSDEVAGCTETEAVNFDPSATDEDGSCLYPTGALDLVGVIDFTVPAGGSAGKAIHLVALQDIADLSVFGIGVANNGGGSDGQEYTLCAESVSAGDDILIVRDFMAMESYFSNCFSEFELVCDQGTSDISQNGDDAIELFELGVVIETFGEIDVDGSGQAWEYTDSWAFQTSEGDWTYGEVNCTDGTENIYASSCLYPICSPLTLGCTDATACNYDATADTDDESCVYPVFGYDCDGVCTEDADNDGICDVFEVAGCADMMACNYDETATDNDGSCEYFTSDFFAWDDNMYIGFPSDSMGCPMGAELYNDIFYTLTENEMGYSWDVDEEDLAALIFTLGTELGTLFYNELDQANLVFCGTSLNVYNSPTFGSYTTIWNGTSFDIASLGIYVVPESTASFGCSDVSACNFDACAIGDEALCEFATVGLDCSGNCLNDADGDGICDEFEVAGCSDEFACNYNTDATDDDGSCVYAEENYDCEGNCLNDADGDGICDEFEIAGCTDEEAENYNETATDDDGSCFYCDFDVATTVTDDVNSSSNGSIDVTISGASGEYDFSWTGPDEFASTDEDIDGLVGGSYNLVITDSNGCTLSVDVEVGDLVDNVQELDASFAIVAYPNPVSNTLTLESDEFSGKALIKLFDGMGRLVADSEQVIGNGRVQLNVSGLATGSYNLIAICNGRQATERIQIR